MKISEIKDKFPEGGYNALSKIIDNFRPVQEKCLKNGLLDGKSQLVCTPTASGKTMVAELAFVKSILDNVGKAIYIVPLKALATEKFHDFKEKYDDLFKVAISIGDMDNAEPYLAKYDLIICTSEKLDSLIRHQSSWLKDIKVVIIDEIHLLNDPGRGPTLEVIITLLKEMLSKVQIIGLSATIGNPDVLAEWLGAKLITDNWRPVELKKGVYREGFIDFKE